MPLSPSMFVNLPGSSHSQNVNQHGPQMPYQEHSYLNRTHSPLLSESSDSSRSVRSLNFENRSSLGRPILPLRKSNTSPLSLMTNGSSIHRPPLPPSLAQNVRNNMFHTKPLKEIHTIPRLTKKPLLDSRILVSRSPSPASISRSNGSLSLIETGSIAELQQRKYANTSSTSSSPLSLYNTVKTTTSTYSSCNGSNYHNPSRSLSVCSARVTKSPTPRRIFPQAASNHSALDINQLNAREQAPVVFDANLTFVLGCDKQKVRQNFRPVAAHLDDNTASSYLSARIEDFLKRTDHVMDEWRNLGHKDDPEMDLQGRNGKRLGKSRSAANIMIKGFQLYSRSGSVCRSSSYTRDLSEDRNTISEMDELSEMTAELAVEQAAGTLAAERLSAETAERLRIERDLQTVKISNTTLQQTSERLETELMYARAETNGSVASETGEGGAGSDSEGSGDGSRYKRRLQVALRELEAARRQLRQQHEDDLEQLVTLKKQLEKKAADAYEEAEEQRQVAAQWKRKAQKAASDANDVRLLLDEQGAKAVLLERRQRKFDAECQQLREEARRERQTRERAQRDYETLLADKCTLEQTLTDTRMELESKEEKLASVQRELEDLTFGGKTEEEIGALKRIKHDLENKCHDQEEELDELAGQVQLLESHKVRLEMSLEQQRKAARLEASQREEELEEVRAQTAKKVKALESQLEMEHNERTLVLRERHELERRLAALEESARADASEREQREQRMKRDLRRYKALARDAQVVLERREQDSGAKAQLRQLRDKLDDAEVTLRAAQKARQTAETELAEALSVAEESSRGRREAEMRATQAQREATSARAQLEEAEEEAADVLKKYRACVTALSEEQRAAREALARATAAEDEARTARERVAELTARLASADNATTAGQAAQNDKLELRTKELEASLELEQTARTRLEAQAARARESAAASAQALAAAQQRDMASADELRKVMRTVRELREELSTLNAKCDEAIRGRSEAEARLDEERSNTSAARADLRATKQRLLLLQQAITDEISPDNDTDSENDSCSSDESIETFLANHKLSPVQPNIHGSTTSRSSEGRQSRSSVSSSKQMSPAKESYA